MLRRPISLRQGECKLVIDSDGSVRGLLSLKEKRALFGFEQVRLYKVQAGIVVHAQRSDWAVRAKPRSVQLTGKIFESIEVAQLLEFHRGPSMGYVRRIRLRNGSVSPFRLRAVALLDPTAAHFRDDQITWGSLGVNAFNRQSHIALDEVSDPPSAKVVGAVPPPSRFYMTTDRSRAQAIVSSGELPEATAGMSGQVLIVSGHDFEIAPGETKELGFASIYSPGKLEDALAEFGKIQSGEKMSGSTGPFVASSNQQVGEAATWAVSVLEGGAFAEGNLDNFESLKALTYLNPGAAKDMVLQSKKALRSDGSFSHSLDSSRPGILESSIFLQSTSYLLSMEQDKKLTRAIYPLVKKMAQYLVSSSRDYVVSSEPGLPQGWRRHLGSGYPTGEIPEVSLAVAGALDGAAQVAKILSKAEDASKFRERSEMISDQVMKKLLDERGLPLLCRDSSGQLRTDETIDMSLAVYRHLLPSVAQAVAHRILEKDFDTPYGPRCVPTSNMVYFNSTYGQGELGGVRPRAVLAHAIACYKAGLSGMGSLALAKIAKLVVDDSSRLGGSPGCFADWVDVESGEIHGDQSDPVAAARFLESIFEGELGLTVASDKIVFSPAPSTSIAWFLASDFWAGETVSAFVGRGNGGAHLFFSGAKVDSKSGFKFAKSERIDQPARGVHAICFYNPGQVICVGNSTPSQSKVTVTFSPKAAELAKHLSTSLEIFDSSRGIWSKIGSLRVSPTMVFEAMIEPNRWQAYRLSNS